MTAEKRLEKEKARQEEAKQSEFCTSTDSFVKSSILNPFAINTDCVREASKIEIASDMSSVATTLDSSGINTEVEISNAFANLAPILTDIMAGDVQALNRPEFACMNFPAILKAIKWLSETDALNDFLRSDLALNAWKLNFKCRPPTMEEFLTPKYIGPTAESLRPFIKDTLINFTDPTKPYRTIALASCIGAGKSTFSVLLQLFISVHYAYMWAPYKYFGLGAATQFTQCLGGWNIKKATELLLEPFMNILEYAPFFHKAKFAQDVLDARESTSLDDEGLLWTTATKTAQPLDCKVYLPDGSYKLMGDIKVGDVIASPTCGEVVVESIPYHGIDDCYEIELEDGRTTRCNAEHLWKVFWERDSEGNPIWRVVQTQFMIDHPELEFSIFDVNDSNKDN